MNICTKLSKQQKKQVWELLEEYQDILPSNPGRASLGEHRIEVTTDQPVRTKAYPLPYAVRGLIQKEVNEMLRMGIIEPSNSAYSCSQARSQDLKFGGAISLTGGADFFFYLSFHKLYI